MTAKTDTREARDLNIQFKKGVLEMVVLCLLAERDCYGFELVTEISKNIDISEGTIYPLLKRLRDEKFLDTYLEESQAGAPRKYYRITELGEDTKTKLVREWEIFCESVEKIVKGAAS